MYPWKVDLPFTRRSKSSASSDDHCWKTLCKSASVSLLNASTALIRLRSAGVGGEGDDANAANESGYAKKSL